jgi:hypothetical protein
MFDDETVGRVVEEVEFGWADQRRPHLAAVADGRAH